MAHQLVRIELLRQLVEKHEDLMAARIERLVFARLERSPASGVLGFAEDGEGALVTVKLTEGYTRPTIGNTPPGFDAARPEPWATRIYRVVMRLGQVIDQQMALSDLLGHFEGIEHVIPVGHGVLLRTPNRSVLISSNGRVHEFDQVEVIDAL